MKPIYLTTGSIKHFWSEDPHPDFPEKAVYAKDILPILKEVQKRVIPLSTFAAIQLGRIIEDIES